MALWPGQDVPEFQATRGDAHRRASTGVCESGEVRGAAAVFPPSSPPLGGIKGGRAWVEPPLSCRACLKRPWVRTSLDTDTAEASIPLPATALPGIKWDMRACYLERGEGGEGGEKGGHLLRISPSRRLSSASLRILSGPPCITSVVPPRLVPDPAANPAPPLPKKNGSRRA